MDVYYYLMAQVPALLPAQVPQLGSSAFLALCEQLLPETESAFFSSISLNPPASNTDAGCVLVSRWYDYERALRDALADLRAQRLDRSPLPHTGSDDYRAQRDARSAMAFESPLEAELFLIERRFQEIDELQGSSWFDRTGASAYLIKTLLLERSALFQEDEGFAEYKRIYTAIMESSAQAAQELSISPGLGEH